MPTPNEAAPLAPSARLIASSVAGFGLGAVRPKRADLRFLRSLTDTGLPDGDRTVSVRALPQVPRTVPAAAIIEGAGLFGRVENAMTTYVIEHPSATFLVDPAYCRDARHRAINELPGLLRPVVTPPPATIPTIDAMRILGVDPDFALPTHAHWDHVCGLLDLPGLPVRLHGVERDWILGSQRPPVGGVRPALTGGREVTVFDLDGPPVSTFAASHDLFGDASVLLVDLPGHTPGSIGVLARTKDGWVLLAGDAAWHYEQVERIRQKPAFPGALVDADRDAAFKTLHRLHLARHRIRVIPTHDHGAARHLGC